VGAVGESPLLPKLLPLWVLWVNHPCCPSCCLCGWCGVHARCDCSEIRITTFLVLVLQTQSKCISLRLGCCTSVPSLSRFTRMSSSSICTSTRNGNGVGGGLGGGAKRAILLRQLYALMKCSHSRTLIADIISSFASFPRGTCGNNPIMKHLST
jgi:hypothetical protein